jgi:hypothetical protein
MVPELLEQKNKLVDEVRKLIEFKELLSKDIKSMLDDQ